MASSLSSPSPYPQQPLSSHGITAGLTYSAIGALTFLVQTPNTHIKPMVLSPGSPKFESLVRWLVSRQTSELGDEESDEEDEENRSQKVTLEGLSLDDRVFSLPQIPPKTRESIQWAGFNGRCNKFADTCYSFWTMATLAVRIPRIYWAHPLTREIKMMDRLPLVDADGNRRYLLEKTQHYIGGFGKGVGEPPGEPGCSLRTGCRPFLTAIIRSSAFVFWNGIPCVSR